MNSDLSVHSHIKTITKRVFYHLDHHSAPCKNPEVEVPPAATLPGILFDRERLNRLKIKTNYVGSPTRLETEGQQKLTSREAVHRTRVTESKIRLEEIKPEEYFNEPVRIEKWTMSEHVRSWASTQELIEEVNHILTEKRVKLDNLANVDNDVVEEFLKDSSTPLLLKPCLSPVIPAPPQTGQSNEGPESLTGSGNKEDSERSVSDGTHKGESDGILATKKEVLVTLDWDSVDGLLREISRRDKASESSASIKTFLEEFNATLQEEFENKVWTYGDTMEDLPRKEVLLPPPPPSLLLHPPAHPPNVSFAFLKFSVDAAVPVRHNGDQENVFGPPIPIVLPPAPSAPPPPSIQVIKEDVDRIPEENFGIVVPTAWNVKEEFLPGNVLLLPPPPSPPVWLGPPQLHTDTLILHSLPIVRLPEGFKLEPIGVLNGEILYGIAPLNAGRRKSNLSTS
ncbi:hypothetical protein CCH79_00001151, partial [Gambusia affinis]